MLLNGIDILKGIRNTNYKLSIIYVVLGVSYFVSGVEIWFHSTFIFSTKNFPSSSSGISADSRSRYWWLWLNHQILVDVLLTFSQKLSVFLCNLFLHTNCQSPLSRLTIERRVYRPTISPDSFMNLIFQNIYSQKSAFLFHGSHHFLIIWLRSFTSSFIFFFQLKIKVQCKEFFARIPYFEVSFFSSFIFSRAYSNISSKYVHQL